MIAVFRPSIFKYDCNMVNVQLSVDTANSKEMMGGSHITKFHTSKQEEPVTTELLNKASNLPGLTCKHSAG